MKKAELIIVPAPGPGHLVSTLEFANRLIDRNDQLLITILVMKIPNTPPVDAYTKSFADSESRIQLIDVPEVEPPSAETLKKSIEYYITLFMESQVSHVRTIVSEIVSSRSKSESVQVTGVVLDFFCVSMIDVANELHLPSYIFVTSNAGFLDFMLYLPTRHDQIGTLFESTDSELLIPGFVNPVPVSVLPTCIFNNYGYSSYLKMAQRFKDVNGIIVNTFSELEPYALNSGSSIHSSPVYAVGPILQLKSNPNPNWSEDQSQKMLNWLDSQSESSVVYLCFGSGGSFSPAQVKEIATGLEQSGFNFLLSLRVSSSSSFLHNQSANDDDFPDGFLERTQGRGMVCGWSPQVEVLSHKAIGGFVSHCGWNSILESLWFGVPIVTWPLYAEQQLNAFRMVKELGLAVELRLDSCLHGDLVMADEIARAIKCLMDVDNEVRKKVKEMSQISRKTLMEGGSSFDALGRFIDLNF